VETQDRMQTVAIVVGSIAQNDKALVYCLKGNGTQVHPTQIIELPRFETPLENLHAIRRTLQGQVLEVWENDSIPCWYYIQIDERYPVGKVGYWSLPITVYSGKWSLAGNP